MAERTVPRSQYLMQIFKETTMILKLGHYIDEEDNFHDIKENAQLAKTNTYTVPENRSFDKDLAERLALRNNYGDAEKKTIYQKIEVTHESTSAAARRYQRLEFNDVCALNFANGFVAGGGVLRGSPAQEETLCRQSNLYYCLVDQKEMYEYNKSKSTPFCSHYMIYSPKVVFFRDDDYDFCSPIAVSVITCPAVDCRKLDLTEKVLHNVRHTTKNRIRKILQLAMYTNNKVLILGAYGCGGFGNNPREIAAIFKELLVDEFYGMYFDKIVFPVYSQPNHTDKNYDAFAALFPAHAH